MQQTIQKQTHKTKKKNAWKYILSVLIILIYILPIYVLVVMAFKHPTDLGSRLIPPNYFDLSNFTSIESYSGRWATLFSLRLAQLQSRSYSAVWRPMRSRATVHGSTASCRAFVWAS